MLPDLSVFPQGLSRHFELKEESSAVLPSPYLSHFPSLPTWAGNRPGQGQSEGHTASKAGILPDARIQPWSRLTAPGPGLRRSPSHPTHPAYSHFSKLLAHLRVVFSPACVPSLPQDPYPGCSSHPCHLFRAESKGRAEGGAQVRMDRDPTGICLTAPSLLDFGCQGGSKNSLFSGLPLEQLCPGLSLSFFYSFSPSQTVARKHPRTDQGSHP